MNKDDLNRRRHDGYFHGSSGRTRQFDWEDMDENNFGGGQQYYGDDARWKNSIRAEHYNNDHFGQGHRERSWNKNLDNRDEQRGKYFGKGPKGHYRSSERIRDEVCEVLADSPHVDASEIEVDVQEGIVTLSGTVNDRRMKKVTEQLVESILGVDDVMNMLRMQGEGSPKENR